jgi:hypothetical protein
MLDEAQQQAIVNSIEIASRVRYEASGEWSRSLASASRSSATRRAKRRAIASVLAVFRFHVEACVPEGIAKGEPERSQRLSELVDIFDRFAK